MPNKQDMLVIGLTGGIASGKSTVSEMFRAHNLPILDADLIAREIMEPGGSVLKALSIEFGHDILQEDGKLNRRRLSKIVFDDKHALAKLNAITHPIIRKKTVEQIDGHRMQRARACVVDAALLIEAGFTDIVDVVVLVALDQKLQLERFMNRDSITLEDAQRIIENQMSLQEKMNYADYIIDNSRDIEFTRQQVDELLDKLIGLEDMNG